MSTGACRSTPELRWPNRLAIPASTTGSPRSDPRQIPAATLKQPSPETHPLFLNYHQIRPAASAASINTLRATSRKRLNVLAVVAGPQGLPRFEPSSPRIMDRNRSLEKTTFAPPPPLRNAWHRRFPGLVDFLELQFPPLFHQSSLLHPRRESCPVTANDFAAASC